MLRIAAGKNVEASIGYSIGYRPDIDGLRAIAITAVVLFHAFPRVLPNGFLGVDVFFVISGYLITGIVWRNLSDGRFTLTAFYTARARRIFPALILVIAAALVLGWFFMLPAEYSQLGQHITAGGLFYSNFQFWHEAGYFDVSSELKPLLHLWSLSVEEQFYLIWPFILMGLRNRPSYTLPLTILIAVGSFACQALLTWRAPDAAFYLPFARFWELMLGAMLAFRPAAAPKRCGGITAALGLALVVASMAIPSAWSALPSWWSLLPTLGTCLVIASGPDNRIGRLVLGSSASIYVGKISYPLYLWHWPLLSFLTIATGGHELAWARGLTVLASTALAWLTYVWVERPIRFRMMRRAAVVPALCSALVALVGLGCITDLSAGFPARLPAPIRKYLTVRYDWAAGARAGRCWLTRSAPFDGFGAECFRGNALSRPEFLVWGDSYAGRLYVGVHDLYGDVGQITRDSCPPIVKFGDAVCAQSNDRTLSSLLKRPPGLLIMFATWSFYASNFKGSALENSLKITLRTLKLGGIKRIMVIGPAIRWQTGLPRIIADAWRQKNFSREIPLYLHGLEQNVFGFDKDMRQFALEEGVDYVSLVKMMCNDDGCLTRASDDPEGLITADQGHFTKAGADYVARRLPLPKK